jgi:hypothetical protein
MRSAISSSVQKGEPLANLSGSYEDGFLLQKACNEQSVSTQDESIVPPSYHQKPLRDKNCQNIDRETKGGDSRDSERQQRRKKMRNVNIPNMSDQLLTETEGVKQSLGEETAGRENVSPEVQFVSKRPKIQAKGLTTS